MVVSNARIVKDTINSTRVIPRWRLRRNKPAPST